MSFAAHHARSRVHSRCVLPPKAQTNPAAEKQFPRCCQELPIRAQPGKVAAPSVAAESMPHGLAPLWVVVLFPDVALRASPTCFSKRSVSIGSGSRGN